MDDQREPNDAGATRLAPTIKAAVALLAEAHHYARRADRDPWEFAVELTSLVSAGLSTSELRWLICADYLDCARDVTRPRDPKRRFQPIRNTGQTDNVNHRDGSISVNGGEAVPIKITSGTRGASPFVFNEASDPTNIAGTGGDYVRFNGLSGDTLSLALTVAPRYPWSAPAGIAGVQIVQTVPEPSSLALLAAGGLLLVARRRRIGNWLLARNYHSTIR